ncbi:MAG: DnaJ domain-containing protein [Psychromonas sp.]|nr:DnaJ domain-containing protein [Psychromonas sp.]
MAEKKRDCYNVLGINKSANAKEIKKAYKKLAMKYHPDRNPDNIVAQEKFREVKSSYEILSNPESREQYDTYGHNAFDKNSRAGAGAGHSGFSSHTEFFDMFNQRQPQRPKPKPQPKKGSNITISLKITLEDSINGCSKDVRLPNTTAPLLVFIPKGISSKQIICVTGQGNPGTLGADRGDLMVEVDVSEHDIFKRKQQDLHNEIDILFTTAALGGMITVPTISGSLNLKIPQGTQDGRKFRIKGKGVPSMKGMVAGDLIYHVNIKIPEILTEEQRNLLTKLAETF